MKWNLIPLIVVMISMLFKKGGLHLTKDEVPHSFTISSLLTWRSFKLEGKSPNLPFAPAAASARKWNCFKEKRIFSLLRFSADHELVEYCDNDVIMCQINHLIDRLISSSIIEHFLSKDRVLLILKYFSDNDLKTLVKFDV